MSSPLLPGNESSSTDKSHAAVAIVAKSNEKKKRDVTDATAAVDRRLATRGYINRFHLLAKLLGHPTSPCSSCTKSSPSASITSSSTFTSPTTPSTACTDLASHSDSDLHLSALFSPASLETMSNEELGTKVRNFISDSTMSSQSQTSFDFHLLFGSDRDDSTSADNTIDENSKICSAAPSAESSDALRSSALLHVADDGVQPALSNTNVQTNEHLDIKKIIEQTLKVSNEILSAVKTLTTIDKKEQSDSSELSFNVRCHAQACANADEFLAIMPATSTVSGYVKFLEMVACDYIRLVKSSKTITPMSYSTA